MSYQKTDSEGYVRDGSSGAILNTDSTAFAAYKQRRQSQFETTQLKSDVDELRTELQEIKGLLIALIREQGK